jgi:hypothetical protein
LKVKHNKIILAGLVIVVIILTARSRESHSIVVHNYNILYRQDDSLNVVRNYESWKPVIHLSYISLPYQSPNSFTYGWIKGEFMVRKNYLFIFLYRY